MKMTPIARGGSCAADVQLSPLDVGFDLRAVGTPVVVPHDVTSVSLLIGGTKWLIEGSRDELLEQIRAAGYRIADAAG